MEQISNKDLHSEQNSHTFSQSAASGGSSRAAWVTCALMTHQAEREHHLLAGCSREAPLSSQRRAESEQNQPLPGRTQSGPVRFRARYRGFEPPSTQTGRVGFLSASCQLPVRAQPTRSRAQSSRSAEEQNRPQPEPNQHQNYSSSGAERSFDATLPRYRRCASERS